jgi:hypothetical protein
MSAQIDDGGPAWPNNDAHGCAYAGMTLRDWFAGQALAGDMVEGTDGFWSSETSDKVLILRAKFLYRFADAMIEARKGGEQ